ncbi:MAG: hypothetical protein IJI73_04670 [Kiritimatiellae bacterium]|nr:hypothetical protein [Kiritimatiellia bacterium]
MTWTIIYRDKDGATKMMEVVADSRTDVYPILTEKGIHPLSIQPGKKVETSGKSGKKRKAHRGESSWSSRLKFLVSLLLLAAVLAVAWYFWIGPEGQNEVREAVRPPGKVSIQIADPAGK